MEKNNKIKEITMFSLGDQDLRNSNIAFKCLAKAKLSTVTICGSISTVNHITPGCNNVYFFLIAYYIKNIHWAGLKLIYIK